MATGSVMFGRNDSGVIVCGPGPGMLNAITSCTDTCALASSIACRSDPDPLSAVVVTTNVRFGLTMVVCAIAVLFVAVGSSDVLVTVAVFVIAPITVGSTTMTTVALVLGESFQDYR